MSSYCGYVRTFITEMIIRPSCSSGPHSAWNDGTRAVRVWCGPETILLSGYIINSVKQSWKKKKIIKKKEKISVSLLSQAGATKPLCSRSICHVESEPTPPHTTFHDQLTHSTVPIFDFLPRHACLSFHPLVKTPTCHLFIFSSTDGSNAAAFATSFHQCRFNTFAYWVTVRFAAGALPSLTLEDIFPETLTSVTIIWIKALTP